MSDRNEYTSKKDTPDGFYPVSETRPEVKPARAMQTKKSSTAFRTISEVAGILDVQQHVLRFWETKFSQVKPLKRGGGRRYYRPEDVELLQVIHALLYGQGYTIKGVQKLLREQGKNAVVQDNKTLVQPSSSRKPAPSSVSSSPASSAVSYDTVVEQAARREEKPDVSSAGSASTGTASHAAAAPQSTGLSAAQRAALKDVLTDLKTMQAVLES